MKIIRRLEELRLIRISALVVRSVLAKGLMVRFLTDAHGTQLRWYRLTTGNRYMGSFYLIYRPHLQLRK